MSQSIAYGKLVSCLFFVVSFCNATAMIGEDVTSGSVRDRKVDIDRLKSEIVRAESETRGALHKVDSIGSDVTRVLLFGVTGSGKSTLLHSLLGIPLFGIKRSGLVKLMPEEEIVEIGHGADSMTSIPNVCIDDKRKIAYCDCPGVLDTEIEQRIVNAFAVNQLLIAPCNVKVLLVMKSAETEAGRGDAAKKVLNLLCNMFPRQDQLEQSIGIVLTQGSSDIDPIAWLMNLNTTSGECNQLLNYFIDKGKDRVFSFPKAENTGMYSAFTDFDRVLGFLETPSVVNPEHNVVLDPEAESYVICIEQYFSADIRDVLKSFCVAVASAYREETDISKLKRWSAGIRELRDATHYGLVAVAEKVGALEQLMGTTSEFLPRIEAFIPWNNFISELKKVSCYLKSLDWEKMHFSLNMETEYGSVFEGQMAELNNMIEIQERFAETNRLYEEQREKEKQEFEVEKERLQDECQKAQASSEEINRQLEELKERFSTVQAEAEAKRGEELEKMAATSQQMIEEMRKQWMERMQRQDELYERMSVMRERLYAEHEKRMQELDIVRQRVADTQKTDWNDVAQGAGVFLGVLNNILDRFVGKK